MISEIRAVVLAGGKGTRLRPYTITLPKPLVPVGERPVLEVVFGQLREAGVTRVTLAVNHMAELLMAYFGEGSRYGLRLDYSLEDQPLGTIGPLRLIEDLPESFLVMNGDVLTDLDYRGFWAAHLASESLASVCTYERVVKIDFGILQSDDRGYLTGFQEKPTLTHRVSMGIYAFRRQILDLVPRDRPFGFDDLMHRMLQEGLPVRCHHHEGQWLDIGRPDDYEEAQQIVVSDAAPANGRVGPGRPAAPAIFR